MFKLMNLCTKLLDQCVLHQFKIVMVFNFCFVHIIECFGVLRTPLQFCISRLVQVNPNNVLVARNYNFRYNPCRKCNDIVQVRTTLCALAASQSSLSSCNVGNAPEVLICIFPQTSDSQIGVRGKGPILKDCFQNDGKRCFVCSGT